VVSQQYESEIVSEYIIRGNNAVLKCSIPAFVADYVSVISWIDSDNQVIEAGVHGNVQHLCVGHGGSLRQRHSAIKIL